MKKEFIFIFVLLGLIYLALSFIFYTFNPLNYGVIGRFLGVLSFIFFVYFVLKNINK